MLIVWHDYGNKESTNKPGQILQHKPMKTKNQNRLIASLVMVAACFLNVVNVSGQVVKVNIKVNTTVAMQETKPFEVVDDNGIKVTDDSFTGKARFVDAMGTFMLKGKENTDVLVKLDAPEVLVNHENLTMPFIMNVAWHNNTAASGNKLKWSANKYNVFKFRKSAKETVKESVNDEDLLAYLYLKGTAEIPANAQSTFEGDVRLTIEY